MNELYAVDKEVWRRIGKIESGRLAPLTMAR